MVETSRVQATPIHSDDGGVPRLIGYRIRVGGKKYFELMVMGGTPRLGLALPCCGRGLSNSLRCVDCSDLPRLRATYDLVDFNPVMEDVLEGFGWDPLSAELAWAPWRTLLIRAVEKVQAGDSKWRGGEWLPIEAVEYHRPRV